MENAIAHLGLLEDDTIVLDAAALEIAALDHDGAAIEPYAERLAGMAARLAVLGAGATTTRQRAGTLARVIGDEFGFAGDHQTYDSPDNADLMRVIDRKRGLPVSLTILYVAAARRIGWQADALNTPGHVLARLGPDPDPILIDPFHAGRIVGGDELGLLLENALGPAARPAAEHLAAMSNRAVLVRLVMNQASRAEANGALDRALVLYRRITTIAPDHPHPWWDRARLEVAAGDRAAARASLSAMLEVTRDPGLRNHVCAALDALARLTR